MSVKRFRIGFSAFAFATTLLLAAAENQRVPSASAVPQKPSNIETLIEKLAPSAIGPVLTALLAILVGNRIAAHWGIRQKRREMALGTANEFYRLYGEFFAIWKLWNYIAKTGNAETQKNQWALLERAAAAEAGVEAILVKLSAERELSSTELDTLGRFRQGYQTLRETIANAKPLHWSSSDHVEYAAFKKLASRIGSIVTAEPSAPPPLYVAERSLREITSNNWEGRWS